MLFFQRNRKPFCSAVPTPIMETTKLPKENRCKFPIGDPRKKDFRFCNEPRNVLDAYCTMHKVLCYTATGQGKSFIGVKNGL